MEKQHEALIRNNKFRLQNDLIVDEILLAHLQAGDVPVLTDGMSQDIEAKPTRSGKASALLSLLPKRGPTAFKVFVEALIRSGQDDLAKLLDPHQTLVSQNGKQPEKEIPTSTEVSNDPEAPTASGGVDKKEASASEKKETSGKESTVTQEKTETASFFNEWESGFITIEVKPPTVKVLPETKFIRNGRAIIINNKNLSEEQSRDGSNFDIANTTELFKKLGFATVIKFDLTVQEMKDVMESESKNCRGIDGLVLCIMGRGRCGQVYGTDGKTIAIDQLTEHFTDVKCPALKGKPRIFITETCRDGDKSPDHPQSPGVDDLDRGMQSLNISHPNQAGQENNTSDVHNNVIKVHCTVKGYKTMRSDTHGSWFIHTLVKTISEGSHEDDVVSLMKQVRRKWTETGNKDMEITVTPSEPSNVYFHPK